MRVDEILLEIFNKLLGTCSTYVPFCVQITFMCTVQTFNIIMNIRQNHVYRMCL